MNKFIYSFIWCVSSFIGMAQNHVVTGTVLNEEGPMPYINLYVVELQQGTVSDEKGNYRLENLPTGTYTLEASYTGYQKEKQQITLNPDQPSLIVNFTLTPTPLLLDQLVVTGTKTFKRQTETAVIVNVVDGTTLTNVQACNLSEGLRFQPGLRVETDCQTCNYTQLRMNGLGGGYSQILINGRPIFSPLTGLYGMEQIPANMIERIEVVRGGGSALYGSSAIGGTVNVLTKIPKKQGFDIGMTQQFINGTSPDFMISGNATALTSNKNAGATFFVNSRQRQYYDHNGDNFSELPELNNTSFGGNFFLLPSKNQKIEASISKLNEYRYGGEMVDKPAYLTLQSEERTHDVWLGSVDYQINFNNDSSSFIVYAAGQYTKRDHYTGIMPDDSAAILTHITHPPYGYTSNTTTQGGVQLNHKFKSRKHLSHVLTIGGEFLADDVYDIIESYQYLIDQQTLNIGFFAQADWDITKKLNFLAGARIDQHNYVDQPIVSPRLSALYKWKKNTQFRVTWGTGFRAPQAFDSDMHIAFAGGGVSRISLANNLTYERSQSLSASVNYDKAVENWVAGFTLEGFYTHLNDAFYLHPLGEDAYGERFEKRNGSGATVQGVTLELRANYRQKAQLEAGITLQSSLYDSAVKNIDDLPASQQFLRTPNTYGFASFWVATKKWYTLSVNYVYTGEMLLTHFAGAPEQLEDAYVTSPDFHELSGKFSYYFFPKSTASKWGVFAGVKNIFNAYQSDFDTGKNRDSNYIYGPGMPRTIYFGVNWSSL